MRPIWRGIGLVRRRRTSSERAEDREHVDDLARDRLGGADRGVRGRARGRLPASTGRVLERRARLGRPSAAGRRTDADWRTRAPRGRRTRARRDALHGVARQVGRQQALARLGRFGSSSRPLSRTESAKPVTLLAESVMPAYQGRHPPAESTRNAATSAAPTRGPGRTTDTSSCSTTATPKIADRQVGRRVVGDDQAEPEQRRRARARAARRAAGRRSRRGARRRPAAPISCRATAGSCWKK